jgi:putative transcriptional regulator
MSEQPFIPRASAAQGTAWLTGQMLVAMPQMHDRRFARTVIYLCVHNPDGAMGLIINRRLESVSFAALLQQLGLDIPEPTAHLPVHAGGPVETGRGFVLHSLDYAGDGVVRIDDRIGLTATLDILRAQAAGKGAERALLALGYAGWGPGQLEQEIQDNSWLTVAGDPAVIFDAPPERKWDEAMAKLGISLSALSTEVGRA